MSTIVTINDLQLDESVFRFPLYRGTAARPFMLYGFAPRWQEYKSMVSGLQGSPAKVSIRGSRKAGADEGVLRVEIPGIYVMRATKVNELSIELECYDARLLLAREVADTDFNMVFGDGYLPLTEHTTYKEAIQKLCARSTALTAVLSDNAFGAIPDRALEDNVHLSAMAAPDPLGYLCERVGVDLTRELESGKFYFASRADATAAWFAGFENYNWRVRPGFMALETVVLQRPRTIVRYYWEHHCIRAEGTNGAATASTYGPDETQISLAQVYLYQGEYYSIGELLSAIGLSATEITDEQIAKAFLSDSAQGSPLHPVDTFQRKVAWGIIRRDWRRLWRIEFTNGSTGGWDTWRFGKLNDDGSVDPTSVECDYVEFKRVVSVPTGQSLEGQPWTFNRDAPSPFKAVWDDGPESGVIRIVPDQGDDRMDDLIPPMPGALNVLRKAGSGLRTDALLIAAKSELENGEGAANTVRNCTLFGREDISRGRFDTGFQIFVYLTARRFMPNDNTRWHKESTVGFADGDIAQVEIAPSAEVQCYRTFVGGTAPAPEPDGLGAVLNNLELHDDAERGADVWKTTHALSAEGHGTADTLDLAKRPRVVDGPVVGVEVVVDGFETYTEIAVGNIADQKARELIAQKRLNARGINVQGKDV